MTVSDLFIEPVQFRGNFAELNAIPVAVSQTQTNRSFSSKWKKVQAEDDLEQMESFQKNWYLTLYGFESEKELAQYLQTKAVILDAGCGTGFKSAWMAGLAPQSVVLGMDASDSVVAAADRYQDLNNLYFIKGNIADSGIHESSIDYVSCDQVIHHTDDPPKTFAHLASLLKPGGEFACYVYAKKALPRELLDDYFRKATLQIPEEQIWEMSKQLTQLGKALHELNAEFTAPDIPLLGIKGGRYDIQRFIYWNFIKCFWKEEWGVPLCDSTNFDWYAPGNAYRYSKQELEALGTENNLTIIYDHSEEACHTARFKK